MKTINDFEDVKSCVKFAFSITVDVIRIIKDEKKKERLCLSVV